MPPRSAFVTGVGRGFSILYGIATMGLLVGLATLDSVPGLPHWRLLMSTALIVDTGTLIAAIGLLRQRPWARATFIVALCASIVLGFAYGLATEAFAAVRWAWIAGLLGSALLYGWIIAKLCSAPMA